MFSLYTKLSIVLTWTRFPRNYATATTLSIEFTFNGFRRPMSLSNRIEIENEFKMAINYYTDIHSKICQILNSPFSSVVISFCSLVG